MAWVQISPTECKELIGIRQEWSVDIWFSLLDESGVSGGSSGRATGENVGPRFYTGSVLIGGQTVVYMFNRMMSLHQQYAVVNSDRKLYCLMLAAEDNLEVASNLELNRWYHVALTFSNPIQKVYLDGQLVSSMKGDMRSSLRPSSVQVGTGCVMGATNDFPARQYSGEYPFNGLIDNFRLWSRELANDEVGALAHGSSVESIDEQPPIYDMKSDLTLDDRLQSKNPTRVSCTRPREKYVVF